MADRTTNRRAVYGRLPWAAEQGESRRFGGILLVVLVLFLVPALWIPSIDLPEPDRDEAEAVPPQLARLVEQRKPPEPVAPPEPVQPEAPETIEPEPDPEPEVAPEPQLAETAPAPKQPAEPRQTEEQAREVAAKSGLLVLKDKLVKMRDPVPESRPQMVANVTDPGGTFDAEAARRREQALQHSGGVSTAPAPVKDVEVAGHEVRQVAVAEEKVAPGKPRPDGGAAERGMNNIRQVFDNQKTALYALYRRELRQDPTLEGKVLLELVIEPDGSVSHCEVVSSDLDNPALETRIANRVRLFNFGADDVEARKVRFPIDFLPS